MENKFTELSQWESREGGKCTVLEVLDNGFLDVYHYKHGNVYRHLHDGRYRMDNSFDNIDLIKPWVPKRSGKAWSVVSFSSASNEPYTVSFDNEQDFTEYKTNERAGKSYKILAIKEIDWTEGEGL